MRQKRCIVFLSLGVFTHTGGIEKFNRCFLKASRDLSLKYDFSVESMSLYDSTPADERYFPNSNHSFFYNNKLSFCLEVLKQIKKKADLFILAHINLAFIGHIIRFLNPSAKIIVVTHGIDVWSPLPRHKQRLLQQCYQVLTVSNYTREKLIAIQHTPSDKIKVFHNTIDPFLKIPIVFDKPNYLADKYGITKDTKVLLTLTRLRTTETYKGYDKILELLPNLISRHKDFKYILAGKADEHEQKRIKSLIDKHQLNNYVVLPGFIEDSEVTDYYLLADCFVMPSKKEGFGIVFIEAMLCGLPVIAGNRDGSVDALQNGLLGRLVDPDNDNYILSSIEEELFNSNAYSTKRKELQQNVLETFGFEKYKQRLSNIFRTVLTEE